MKKAIRYVEVASITNSRDGGPNISWMVDDLRRAGIRAIQYPSCYVGQTIVAVQKGKLTAAKKIMRNYVSWI